MSTGFGLRFATSRKGVLRHSLGRVGAIALGYEPWFIIFFIVLLGIVGRLVGPSPISLVPLILVLTYLRWTAPELDQLWLMTGTKSRMRFQVEVVVGFTLKVLLWALLYWYFTARYHVDNSLWEVIGISCWLTALLLLQSSRMVFAVGYVGALSLAPFIPWAPTYGLVAWCLALIWYLQLAETSGNGFISVGFYKH